MFTSVIFEQITFGVRPSVLQSTCVCMCGDSFVSTSAQTRCKFIFRTNTRVGGLGVVCRNIRRTKVVPHKNSHTHTVKANRRQWQMLQMCLAFDMFILYLIHIISKTNRRKMLKHIVCVCVYAFGQRVKVYSNQRACDVCL